MSFGRVVRVKALGVIVGWTLAASLFVGLVSLVATPVAAANCSRTGGAQPGDWTILAGNAEECVGIVIPMDGNLNVQGTLTIRGGGLRFTEDTSHRYQINVNGATARLNLIDTTVWTEAKLIEPYIKLEVLAGAGARIVATGTTLAFPGWINATGGSTLIFTNSIATRTTAEVSAIFSTALGIDDNDDGPAWTVDSSTASFFGSRVERLFQSLEITAPDLRTAFRLLGSATLTVVDSFLAIDFCCKDPVPPAEPYAYQIHNELTLAGTARAYLYGIFVDMTIPSGKDQDQLLPSISAAAGTTAYIYRFGNVQVVDGSGTPVPLANVTAPFAGGGPGPQYAYFPDNANLNYPPGPGGPGVDTVLDWLGKTSTTWNQTGPDGFTRMPLLSEWIDSTTMPNSRFVGAYNLTTTFSGQSGQTGLTFNSYPALDQVNATKAATIVIGTLFLPRPDLLPLTPTFTPSSPRQGDNVTISWPIANLGTGAATSIRVIISRGAQTLNDTVIPFLLRNQTFAVGATIAGVTVGTHIIEARVDPPPPAGGSILEQSETNNNGQFPLVVSPLRPDLQVGLSFSPFPAFQNNPVDLIANVFNIGDANASEVPVSFYIQGSPPDETSAPVGTATIPSIGPGGAESTSIAWTPTTDFDVTVWAWVDPGNPGTIIEYNETAGDNQASGVLIVDQAPDLVVFPQDLALDDPLPYEGQTNLRIKAIVRNNGQANGTTMFQVSFFANGVPVSTSLLPQLDVGEQATATSSVIAPFSSCGTHSISVAVDSDYTAGPFGEEDEGLLYEANNNVTTNVQVFSASRYTWFGGTTIDADSSISRSLEISGPGVLTVNGATLTVIQDQDPCGRYFVKVLGGGQLVLNDASITSNWPLAVAVADGGTLVANGATFTLDVQGRGVLLSQGTLSLMGSTVIGDLVAKGTSATLTTSEFHGALFHVDTAQTTRIWDATFPGVSTLRLATDSAANPDLDIRNVTFNAAQTAQIVFAGNQWAHLTSVNLTKSGDWWTGMATQNAHITRYWWLTLEAVDGTGTPIQDGSTTVDLRRFNPVTPAWEAVPNCALDDCYFNSNDTWPWVGVPTGRLIYRAAAEDRYGPLGPTPSVRATYRATGVAFIENQTRQPDTDPSALVTSNMTIRLVFSELTPDLQIESVQFDGGNGINVPEQPVNREMFLVARVQNEGQIVTRSVRVHFYDADVDVNRDGFMDQPHQFYVDSNVFLNTSLALDVQPNSTVDFTAGWIARPPLTSRLISAVVDPLSTTSELNEGNNIAQRSLLIFNWPDLHLATNPVSLTDPPVPIVGNIAALTIDVRNEGGNPATNARVSLYNETGVYLNVDATATIAAGVTGRVTVFWTPIAAGPAVIQIRVDAAGAVYPGNARNWDFDTSDNLATSSFNVATQPDLTVAQAGALPPPPFRNQPFDLTIWVNNTGDSTATSININVFETTETNVFGSKFESSIAPGNRTVTVRVGGISGVGTHALTIFVDANRTVNEQNEANNQFTVQILIRAPPGEITLRTPLAGQKFQPGSEPISVWGTVIQSQDPNRGAPIGGVNVSAFLRVVGGAEVPGTRRSQVSSASRGEFVIPIQVPQNQADGTYEIVIEPADASVQGVSVQVRVERVRGIFDTTFLFLPVWVWLIVIIGAAVAIGGGTAYVKFFGLGKLVECGECGSFIPQDSAKCPKCGVEFEKDMAKCSNCQAWIPAKVKQCPECGVEFSTGEVEMADYETQMKSQYDEVRTKLKEQAQRDLGRSLNDREFDDWWRTQPTYVSFEDWLREEEEMRRMGSKPCPVCNTLNSVTATVCHKCGTLLKEAPAGKGGAPPALAKPAAASPAEAPVAEQLPAEALPKKVVKKPVAGAPVVQKKVIKRPVEEGKEGEGTGGDEEQI